MKLLYVINKVTNTSIPLELAEKMNTLGYLDVKVLSFYDTQEDIYSFKKESNFKVDIIGLGVKSILSVKNVIYFNRIIKGSSPDITHSLHTLSGSVARILSAFKKNIKVIHTVHADHRSYSKMQNILIGLSLPFCDLIICNSKNTRDSLISWQKKLVSKISKVVIYNGVDVPKITNDLERNTNDSWYRNLNIDNKTFLIGTVGRLVKVKDHETLIKGFAKVNTKIRNSKLIIVGNGPLKNHLESLATSLGIEKSVIFTGLVTREEVYRLLKRMNLFVVTSVYEGFCNALVEGMIAKKPTIVTDINPLPEVVGGKNALFFNKGDYEELSSKMFTLYNNPELGKNIAFSAHNYAINNYSLNTCAYNHLNYYDKLLHK